MTLQHQGVVIEAGALENLLMSLFIAAGLADEDARVVADTLVDADLSGVESHGVIRAAVYVERLLNGDVKARPDMRFAVDDQAMAVLDADNGMGQVAAASACDAALSRASRFGVGAVAVRRSNHFGAAAYYGRRLAHAGAVGLVFTNAPPLMAPWGAAERVLGNNPICIAAPAEGDVVTIDVSLTVAAGGKFLAAHARGEPIREGWAFDRDGAPMLDGAQALAQGLLMPLGEHKGSGLAFMVDVLTGVLSGGGFGRHVRSIYGQSGTANDCAHLVVALDIEHFLPLDEFRRRIGGLVDQVRSAPLLPGFEQVFLPGELEADRRRKQRVSGVPVPSATAAALRDTCERLDVAWEVL